MEQSRRYNESKLRYDLLPPKALEELVKVYTLGAEKYTVRDEEGRILDDGANNWKKGQPWLEYIASAQRHIQAFVRGEDMDELGTYNLGNAIWNLMSILEHYELHPELDNREHWYTKRKRIALDIDGVLADFAGHLTDIYNLKPADWWIFDRRALECYEDCRKDKKFWLDIPRIEDPSRWHFEPVCYISNRKIPVEWTEEWLDKMGFPSVPVYHTDDKVSVAKNYQIDLFIDDKIDNFVELNKAGIHTKLYTQDYNEFYNVGYKRINNLICLKS